MTARRRASETMAALDEIQYAPNVPGIVKYLYDATQIGWLPGIKFLIGFSSLLKETGS